MMEKILARIRPDTLGKKTTIFILLPTLIFLTGVGFIGNTLVREALQSQWQETAITQMERSAHLLDMRLMRPKEILRFIQHTQESSPDPAKLRILLDLLGEQEGVVATTIDWFRHPAGGNGPADSGTTGQPRVLPEKRSISITPPAYNESLANETVTLRAFITDGDGHPIGQIEVVVNFYDLIDQIVKAPWWRSDQVVLVDDDGRVLLRTPLAANVSTRRQVATFGKSDRLERDIFTAMADATYGTVYSTDHDQGRVSGFYRLSEAPWTIIIISQTKRVLQPILRFRTLFLLLGGLSIIAALAYIRLIINSVTRGIHQVSEAANRMASGETCPPLTIRSHDEVGELTRSFNIMAAQLEERLQLRFAMRMAEEVQQNLLPQTSFAAEGIEISGASLYCQHAGGDYFDILPRAGRAGVATVVVGDVVGHGIGAALLMASLRAMVRTRSTGASPPVDVVTDVNRLLTQDTRASGHFATLFYLSIDRPNAILTWVRCGHDPAMVYLSDSKRWLELRGDGLALGVDDNWVYHENRLPFQDTAQIILIGTDGIWEAENGSGERFGKERLKSAIVNHRDLPAAMLVARIIDELRRFQGDTSPNDDVTMAIIKTWQ
ncbi:MAG: SpoIIE family protein phosphatase [Desulfopila sp.]